MTPEGQIKADCRKIARKHGLLFWQVQGKGVNGIPDTDAGHVDGRGVVKIEFETPIGQVSVQQEKRMAEYRAAGERVAVCRSVDDYRRAVGLLVDKRQPVPGVYGDDL